MGRPVKLRALAAADWTALDRLANEPKSSTYAIWETVEILQDHAVRLIVVKSSAWVNKARAKMLARQVTLGVRWDREAQHLHRKFFDLYGCSDWQPIDPSPRYQATHCHPNSPSLHQRSSS